MRNLLVAGGVLGAVAVATALLSGGDGPAFLGVALCLPTSAAVLALFALFVKDGRVLLVAAFAWGALGAGQLAGLINDATSAWALASLDPGPALTMFSAGEAALVEEGLKLAVVVAIVWWRVPRSWAGWVFAIIVGAAAGAGFNFSEAAGNLANDIGAGDAMGAAGDWLLRQVVELVPGHAAYTALGAAGIGAAILFPWRPALRVAVGWCGVAGAVGAHFVWDAWGAGLPAPDGWAGIVVSAAEALAVDGVSLAVALATLLLALRAARRGRPVQAAVTRTP